MGFPDKVVPWVTVLKRLSDGFSIAHADADAAAAAAAVAVVVAAAKHDARQRMSYDHHHCRGDDSVHRSIARTKRSGFQES